MGLRLRLEASYDVSAATGASLVILQALQHYGLILADNGSEWYISGDSDDRCQAPLMGAIVTSLHGVHGSDFEVVTTGQDSDSSTQVVSKRCGRYSDPTV